MRREFGQTGEVPETSANSVFVARSSTATRSSCGKARCHEEIDAALRKSPSRCLGGPPRPGYPAAGVGIARDMRQRSIVGHSDAMAVIRVDAGFNGHCFADDLEPIQVEASGPYRAASNEDEVAGGKDLTQQYAAQ